VLHDGDEPAGYFELKREASGAIEIAYFGLLPSAIGRALGKHLLTLAVEHAWRERPSRVWLHTSSLDHPHALGNYMKRGFRIVRVEQYETA
jgi:ribosomal protein S18 acetylase RimI-like enzyme